MDKYDLYRDIATRTGGDIYVGVVGPVRTGKSTVVKQFMEKLVVDGIKDADARARAIDEIPQSADGKTIMTTQPRFVPAEAARVNFRDNLAVNMRLIDCVGYLVAGALGGEEDGRDRMVSTPWSEEDMPFAEAAEIGTDKVIREHSTVAVAVLTDGSFTGIPREQYIPAEEKVIAELKRTGKPFAVLLNTADPAAESARTLAAELAAKYDAPVTVAHAPSMTESDISAVMEDILLEFGVRRIDLKLPRWVQALPADDEVVREMLSAVRDMGEKVSKMKDYEGIDAFFEGREFWQLPSGVELEAGEGRIEVTVRPKEDVFYRVASRESGLDITDDFSLLANIRTMAAAKSRTERLAAALEQAEATGYGIVHPTVEEMTLGEPEIIRQGQQYGVRLSASAPSLHIMRVDVKTEVSPIVGSEQQSSELLGSLLRDFEGDKQAIWQTNIFGRSLSALVADGIRSKLDLVPADAENKLRRTLGRIVNEGKGGVICILL
ncbi:MAG TPA: stage IV sporulation protein A [Candidatus Limadaptatus stercoripullorum]|uniref:Stage IV sporulation protein A n=1 Tax=Candidatus Limadaptatus stercoripullorum TaxID=2840846 RepID=A0A9D1NAL0_9FIRM|nr:stage IV sporulation protein A [Candidatus Limadaptatus stercoripullorum]